MDNMISCIAQKTYINQDNLTARFDVNSIQENSSWVALSEEAACEVFPHKGRIFRSLKKDHPNFISSLASNNFFLIKCSENTSYDPTEVYKDFYYAQTIFPLTPIINAPYEWKDNFEIARRNLRTLDTFKERSAFLFFNNSYFKVVKKESNSDQELEDSFYEFEVLPNDKATVVTYHISNDKHISVSGGIYCLDTDATLQPTNYYSGKESQFISLIVNRFKKFSLQYDVFQEIYKALEELKHLSSFFEGHLSQYDQTSLQQRISFLQNELLADDTLKTAVFQTITESNVFKRKLNEFEKKEHDRIAEELNVYQEKQENLIDRELASFKKQKEQVAEQLADLVKERKQLEEIVVSKKQEIASLSIKLTDEVLNIKKALTNCSYAEFSYARAFAERMEQHLEIGQVKLLPPIAAPWQKIPQIQVDKKIPENKVPLALSSLAEATGYDPDVLVQLDGFSRAGEMPFLFGEGSVSYLQQYANVVSGGVLYRMQADPSTLSLDDLWRTPGTQLPTALALAWNAASDEGSYHLVNINIEESPCHLWIQSFFEVLHSSLRPRTLLVVLTGHHFLENVDSILWTPWVVPVECPAAELQLTSVPLMAGIPNASLSDVTVSEELKKNEDVLRAKALIKASPVVAEGYPLWPLDVPEYSLLGTSKSNFPF